MVSFSSPTNWSRTCAVWIDEIRIGFEVPEPQEIRGGFLRAIRRLTAFLAVGVTLSFTLHCTRPPAVPSRSGAKGGGPEGAVAGNFVEEGLASWYGGNGDGFAGKPTASGELFDPQDLTAAHRTLPLGTLLLVENLDNGRAVTVRVNDRGPFVKGRILDLSKRGAQVLGYAGQGTAKVRIRAVDPQGRSIPIPVDMGNPFVVQVAALSDARNIEALRHELEAAYPPVTLQDAVTKDGREVKRVRVGSFGTREEAEKAADELARKLKDRGVEPFITRRR
jgi:rare lipoprotein A